MALTVNGITADEIVEGYGEAFSLDDGGSAEKKYMVDWADRYAFAKGLLGFVTYTSGPWTFTSPYPHPELNRSYVRSIAIEGKGRPSQGSRQIAFTKAIVTASFKPPTMNFGPGDDPSGQNSIDSTGSSPGPLIFATQKMSFSAEYLTIPGSALKFSDGTPINHDKAILVSRADLSITLHQYPYLPALLILNMIGAVNSTTFLGAPTGYCRYNGGDSNTSASTDGSITQELTHSFSVRNRAGWNRDFHPNGTSGWVEVQDQNGNVLQPYMDLNPLIPTSYRY